MPTYGSYERENQGYSYQNSEEAGTGKLTDPNRVDYVDDSGHSAKVRDTTITTENVFDLEDDSYRGVLHANNFFTRNEIDLFNKDYRFGVLNPYGAIGAAKEVLFFTKPDLNILERDERSGELTVTGGKLINSLSSKPFWRDLFRNKKRIINSLQLSADPKHDNFIHLLQNQVSSNLEIPSLDAETVDTPINMYGVGFSYRGSSEASDDGPEFSLEFKDTKWLDVYYFFKTYEEYETLKHHGIIAPWRRYIENKVIHDQFAIYKFILDEDMETILYYGKYYGVMPKSLPRDVFSSASFEDGISYSVNFKAAFYEDMRPEILSDFNYLSSEYYHSLPYQIDVYNDIFDRVDHRPAQAAYIEKVRATDKNIPGSIVAENSPDKFVYKLRWRGSDKV